MVQQSSSGSTELSAAADQMLKLSRQLIDSMDRFVLDREVQPRRSQISHASTSPRRDGKGRDGKERDGNGRGANKAAEYAGMARL